MAFSLSYKYTRSGLSNLDYESCEWTFQGVFDMTSLVTICDGQIAADGQVREVTLVMF
jgi:hypothetical protein